MSVLSRLKYLWALSDTTLTTALEKERLAAKYEPSHEELKAVLSEPIQIPVETPQGTRMATVVQDDPLDAFPSDENETKEEPAA